MCTDSWAGGGSKISEIGRRKVHPSIKVLAIELLIPNLLSVCKMVTAIKRSQILARTILLYHVGARLQNRKCPI